LVIGIQHVQRLILGKEILNLLVFPPLDKITIDEMISLPKCASSGCLFISFYVEENPCILNVEDNPGSYFYVEENPCSLFYVEEYSLFYVQENPCNTFYVE